MTTARASEAVPLEEIAPTRYNEIMDRQLKPAVRWVKAYWDEEDIWFYFEADEDGTVLRQVELQGPDHVPTVAAAWAEWPDPDEDGPDAIAAYGAKYGALADRPLTQDDPDFPGVEIDCNQFENIWNKARAHLESKTNRSLGD